MQTLASSYFFWIGILLALFILYMTPTIVGIIRGVDQLALVFLVNLIGAPTGIGWLAALILALGPRRPPPPNARTIKPPIP